ncbi:MAG: EamA family transporter [Microbacterium sp.]
MLAAALALVGALIYGGADFFGGLAARRLRAVVVTVVAALSGMILLVCAGLVVDGAWSEGDLAWGVLAGLFGAAAVALLYACLAIGPMSILSPLTAVVAAVAPMLWGLLVYGEQLSLVGYAGLGVAVVAVVLVGFIPGEKVVRPSVRGVAMAIGAGLAIGAFLIVIDQTSSDSGLLPLVASRATTAVVTALVVAVFAIAAARARRPAASVFLVPEPTFAPSAARAWWLAIACGAVDAAANALALLALRLGELSIVSALTALYPAGTIVLAAIVLRERVAAVQWAGLALALAAGALLAFN